MSNQLKTKWWLEIAALALISALIYLPGIHQFSYYRDDWYYAYDGYIAGSGIFKIMFSSDRPARGIFFGIYYALFGAHPLPYHIGAYLWRLLGAYGALWLFHLLWSRQRATNFLMALLFVTYPGFLWWTQGMEYQPMIASLTLHTFSFALTLAALQAARKRQAALLWAGSILTGLTAIALVDYAVGMEAFRILCIFLFISRQSSQALLHRIRHAARAALIPLSIPLLFLVWKFFIFQGDRKATDISFQLGDLLRAPLETTQLWGGRLLSSALNVSFMAWQTPLQQYYYFLKQDDLLISWIIATISIALTALAARQMTTPQPDPPSEADSAPQHFSTNAIGLGLSGVLFGLLPIIMANRFVIFKGYSHYALPASLAAVILLVGLINVLAQRKLQIILISLLIGIAALTHRELATRAIHEQILVRNFWWQVYWRIPKIQEGTALAAIYPNINYEDDTDIVWGPANFLYYPQPEPGATLIKYKLGATRLDEDGIQEVLKESAKVSKLYRSHTMFLNYRRVLVLSQPSESSCVHVIDPRWHEISTYDHVKTSVMFPRSKIEYALTENKKNTVPLTFAFGVEPAHDWCFYYQKADLARQQGDWESVAALGAEAEALGLAPADLIEWTPFIQAYAALGQTEKVEQLAAQLKDDSFHNQQFCENLNRMSENGIPLPGKEADLFCTP